MVLLSQKVIELYILYTHLFSIQLVIGIKSFCEYEKFICSFKSSIWSTLHRLKVFAWSICNILIQLPYLKQSSIQRDFSCLSLMLRTLSILIWNWVSFTIKSYSLQGTTWYLPKMRKWIEWLNRWNFSIQSVIPNGLSKRQLFYS